MFRRFTINFALLSICLDAGFVILALATATHLRPLMSELPYTAIINQPLTIPSSLYILFPLAWVSILLLLSVYDGRRNLHVTDEIISLTVGSFLAGVFLAGTLYFSFREVSRILFLVFASLAFLSQFSWRMIVRLVFRLGTIRPEQRRVLIAGAGPVGRKLQENITQNPHLGLSLIGFLDDDSKKRKSVQDILGSLVNARELTSQHKVNDVVIALPHRAYKKVNQLVFDLHDLAVKVWVIPDYFQLALHKAAVEEFAGIPMLDLRAPALNEYQRLVKRAFDLSISLFVLPPSLIIMGIIALLIRLEGKGPILFSQQRVGENGRLFWMHKFRTMIPNAEQLRHLVEYVNEEGDLIHKTEDDPRVTRIGRFLRRTSLDELPQLFNVIAGDMSIIGPRPELPYLVEKYEPWQRTRFAVPQGITGWWQVNGRSDKPMHLHTEDDLYYVRNYSLILDIRILLKTIATVLRGRGAY
jgi:exopolysaccharide biosynthesis polyprenyl glycosylphosphotransferase